MHEHGDNGSNPESARNSGKPWTPDDDARLRELAAENTPTRVIGLKVGRTEAAVFAHASRIGVSLKPVNQSPFSRRVERYTSGNGGVLTFLFRRV